MHSSRDKAVVTGGSAFNIKAESLRVGHFDRNEVAILYGQHTEATGQAFDDVALRRVWTLTRGQPWLVNALGYQVCFETETHHDRSIPITADMIDDAKEALILRRDTHLDQLLDKLAEPRVRRVLAPILSSAELEASLEPDDVQYAVDLGLVERREGSIEVANPIYREIVPRSLTDTVQIDPGPPLSDSRLRTGRWSARRGQAVRRLSDVLP